MRALNFRIGVIAALSAALNCLQAQAQSVADYPDKPVRIIVPTAPGGGHDYQARMFAQKLSENLKRSFVVENRAGGGGTIGYGYAAKAAPDGYTLLSVAAAFTVSPALYPSMPDPIRDYAPISLVTRAPYLLLAHPALPVKTPRDLIALARSKPGVLDIGVGYNGSLTHLAAVLFVADAGVKVTIVPYKGVGQVMVDAMSGQIDAFLGNMLSALPQVKAGRLKMLGVSSAERSKVLPDVPTLAESGAKGYDVTTWQGWLAPLNTPPAIISKLSSELSRVAKAPEIAKSLADDGGEGIGSKPEVLEQLLAAEVPRWRKIVKELDLHAE